MGLIQTPAASRQPVTLAACFAAGGRRRGADGAWALLIQSKKLTPLEGKTNRGTALFSLAVVQSSEVVRDDRTTSGGSSRPVPYGGTDDLPTSVDGGPPKRAGRPDDLRTTDLAYGETVV